MRAIISGAAGWREWLGSQAVRVRIAQLPSVRQSAKNVSTNISFGDNVRILRTAETERLGIAEMIGNVYGETSPSISKVEVIGALTSDYAFNVYFDTLDVSFWIAPHMLEFVNHAPGTEVHVHGSPFKSVHQSDGTWKDIPLGEQGKPWLARLLDRLRFR